MSVTPEQFRKLALDCPDATEGAHQNHPDFRLAGRVFASLQPDVGSGMVKLSPGAQQQVLAANAAFQPATGAWGRAGCTMVTLDAVGLAELRDAMLEAWQHAAALSAQQGAKHRAKK